MGIRSRTGIIGDHDISCHSGSSICDREKGCGLESKMPYPDCRGTHTGSDVVFNRVMFGTVKTACSRAFYRSLQTCDCCDCVDPQKRNLRT